ncbi:hypothetical protein ASD02_29055 [Ensifer sp. Root1252]|nr:hypothetical protein ASD02_29055 [Ensifer sp. Root1252]KRC75018.1 hypothetical protein ASE32_31395 [Ensifer sp. Root231]KRC96486.1 hypothetical protein ASE47_31760 [Ensifer sp. Root258]
MKLTGPPGNASSSFINCAKHGALEIFNLGINRFDIRRNFSDYVYALLGACLIHPWKGKATALFRATYL